MLGTMPAWRIHELGEPERVMRLDDVPCPTPAPDEVLLEVGAVALNLPDVLICRGEYQVRPDRPFVPGSEMAATVVAVGDAATPTVSVGDRVSAIARLPTGALAGYTTLRADDVYPVPDSMTSVVAATLNGTYITSWFALHRRANLAPGETVLVHAGTSGVGIAAIQLAVAAGARVLATAGGEQKRLVCEELGAERGIDYTKGELAAAVLDATDGRGADVIVDPVGGDVFDQSRRCVAFEGRIVIVGFAGGRIAELKTNHPLLKNYSVIGLNLGQYRTRGDAGIAACHAELVRLHAEGRLDPVVADVVQFADAPAAMARVSDRARVGRIVVRGPNAPSG